MKKIFKYFVLVLSIAMAGAFTACVEEVNPQEEELVLGIKVFSPTKVVPGTQMTINGTCFEGVKEVVFPEGISVTNFKLVGDGMIRVTVPNGIAPGKIKVRKDGEEAESRLELTVGNPVISGYSKQPGETVNGGELLSIYGKDLEFISSVELLDADGNPSVITDDEFYRKGTSTVMIIIPKKVYEGTFAGKVSTVNGKVFTMPELTYAPAAEEGHWETVKVPVWTNEDPATNGAVSWSGVYRFALEGHDDNSECIAELPQDVWDKLLSETFYIDVEATDPQIRVTNGWWDVNFADDFQPGNDLLTDNGDGTWTLEVSLANNPDFVATLEEKHLLFTGDRYTPVMIYFTEEQWVGGGEGHMELQKTSIWLNDDPATNGAVSWSGVYRFSNENASTGEEIYAIPMDVWEQMKTTTFYIDVEGTDPQVRVTNGWWDSNYADDFQPGNEKMVDNGDGTWTITVNLADNPDFVASIDEKHLLITGDRFTPLEIYFAEEVWVGGGGGGSAKEVVFWEGDGATAVSWNGVYRFALEGHDDNNECIAEFPEDVWNIIKTGTFYVVYTAPNPEQYQVRITNGWWDTQWLGKDNDIAPWANTELITDNEDGTFTIEITLGDDPLVETLDEKHLLITGDGFTPLKLYYLE